MSAISSVSITVHQSRKPGASIFVAGPGGVGKTTLGRLLAPLLGLPLIDLDAEFCDRVANVGAFIRERGYDSYRERNGHLARELSFGCKPSVFVLSSGFLAGGDGDPVFRANLVLASTGFLLTLLPSDDVDAATATVVERQLGRGFGLNRGTEEAKFRERFARYRDLGDMRVISSAAPLDIAREVHRALVADSGRHLS